MDHSTRLPCPSPSPGACLSSCPLSRWCYLTVSSSATPLPLNTIYFLFPKFGRVFYCSFCLCKFLCLEYLVTLFKVTFWISLVSQMVKSVPAMQETQVRSLGWEDPLKNETLSTALFLHGESHGLRSLVDYSPWGLKEWDMTEWLTLSLFKVELCLMFM